MGKTLFLLTIPNPNINDEFSRMVNDAEKLASRRDKCLPHFFKGPRKDEGTKHCLQHYPRKTIKSWIPEKAARKGQPYSSNKNFCYGQKLHAPDMLINTWNTSGRG